MNQKRIAILKALSALSTLLGLLLSQGWLLIVLVLLFVLDTTPHLRWDYAYQDYGTYRAYTRCTYVGVKGFVSPFSQTGIAPLSPC
jgi:ABC-type polysaccharide transport system permease subunit